jgi:thymidylate synthase ThyX
MEGSTEPAVLETAPPVVTLRTAPTVPYDGAIAAARTCYSPRVIAAAEVTEQQRDVIGALTFDAGHHTVYQHAHFEFGLENVSRQFVWTFLHSYPFYNSEQSSQRYVKLKEPRAFVPPLSGEALDVYESAIVRAWDRYAALSALLKDDALAILRELRYVRPTTNPERLKLIDRDAEKRAIETARYVIPIGAFTSMVHTISGIVLHRLQRMVNTGDAPTEARAVVSEMVRLVTEWDPLFFEKVGLAPIDQTGVPEASFPKPRGGSSKGCTGRSQRSMVSHRAMNTGWSASPWQARLSCASQKSSASARRPSKAGSSAKSSAQRAKA